jgi:acetyl esterase/lipase
VLAVVEYIRSHAAELEVDPQKLVLLGRSAGGQLATAVAYGPRGAALFRGVIALYAPHDLEFAWKYSDVRDVLNSPRLMKQFLGGTPDTVRAAFVDASGYDQVTHSAPPTLLIHGKLDSLVWHRQSERLHERLDQLGVPNVFISLPWATHAFDFNPHGPGGQLSEFAIDEFLRRTTR